MNEPLKYFYKFSPENIDFIRANVVEEPKLDISGHSQQVGLSEPISCSIMRKAYRIHII